MLCIFFREISYYNFCYAPRDDVDLLQVSSVLKRLLSSSSEKSEFCGILPEYIKEKPHITYNTIPQKTGLRC